MRGWWGFIGIFSSVGLCKYGGLYSEGSGFATRLYNNNNTLYNTYTLGTSYALRLTLCTHFTCAYCTDTLYECAQVSPALDGNIPDSAYVDHR